MYRMVPVAPNAKPIFLMLSVFMLPPIFKVEDPYVRILFGDVQSSGYDKQTSLL